MLFEVKPGIGSCSNNPKNQQADSIFLSSKKYSLDVWVERVESSSSLHSLSSLRTEQSYFDAQSIEGGLIIPMHYFNISVSTDV